MARVKQRRMPPVRNSPPRKPPPPADVGEIRHGTVGHAAGGKHYDFADGEMALVAVTLYAGFNAELQGENTTPELAKGREIWARYDSAAGKLPVAGDHVIVARPAGLAWSNGSSIINVTRKDPKWIPNRKPDEQIIYGPNDSFLRFKEDGTIFLFCKDGDGDDAKPIYVELSRKGIEARHPYGSARWNQEGFGMDHASGAAISGGSISAPAPLNALSSYVALRAAIVRLNATATSIGPDGSAPDSLLLSTPVLSTLNAMQDAIESIFGLFDTVVIDLASAAAAPAVAYAPTLAAEALLKAPVIAASATAIGACTTSAPTHACTSA